MRDPPLQLRPVLHMWHMLSFPPETPKGFGSLERITPRKQQQLQAIKRKTSQRVKYSTKLNYNFPDSPLILAVAAFLRVSCRRFRSFSLLFFFHNELPNIHSSDSPPKSERFVEKSLSNEAPSTAGRLLQKTSQLQHIRYGR